MTHKHESPGDVAKRIKEWLVPNGRENTASLLLYEAMLALEGVAHAQAHVRPVGTLKVMDRSKYGHLTKIIYTHCSQELPDGRYDLYTRPEASAPGLSDEARHLLEDASGVLQAFATTSQTANSTQRNINEFLTRASAATVAEPSDPTGLIARLRIHAEDRANTAFARSSMREAAGVLEDRQAQAKGCGYCDGTGDVTRADGEWLGECTVCKTAEQQAERGTDVEQAKFLAAVINLAELPEEAHEKPFPDDDMNSFWAIWKAARAAQCGQQATMADTAAARDVLTERKRQTTKEGWTTAHDDAHTNSDLALAAAAYALHVGGQKSAARITWPQTWSLEWFKPTAPRRDLVKAGALILAEIERLDRAAAPMQQEGAR